MVDSALQIQNGVPCEPQAIARLVGAASFFHDRDHGGSKASGAALPYSD